MRRHLLTMALTGVFGTLLLAGPASACCHKRAVCYAPTCVPCVAPTPAPPPPPPPPVVAECAPVKKKCCLFKGGLFKGLCHKRATCAPVYYAPAYCATPTYAAPAYYSGPSVQSSGQGY